MRKEFLAVLALLAVVSTGCRSAGDVPDSPAPNAPATSASSSASAAPPLLPPAPSPSSPLSPGGRWQPSPGVAWQWQLTTPVDTGVDVPVYDIDGHENSAAVVAALHAKGRKVICYVNTGAAENFRPDHGAFPPGVLGEANGWKGEKWLDIRQRDVLRPIMAARFDECRHKGFDAVEADLVDGYTNQTGFPLTASDQLAYNKMLADLAHERDLSIGLKNDLDQIPELVGAFEFAVNEQCAEHEECQQLVPFIRAGKAVFHVEYELDNADFCAGTTALHFSSMRKNLALDAPRWPC